MWLMTDKGFFSVTRTQSGELQARARLQEHLEALKAAYPQLAGLPIIRTDAADYRWRLVIPAEVLPQIVAAEVASINYSNFKDHCHTAAPPKGRNAYLNALHEIWHTMYSLQLRETMVRAHQRSGKGKM